MAEMQRACLLPSWHRICGWQSQHSRARKGTEPNNINSKQCPRKRSDKNKSMHCTTSLFQSPPGSIKRPLFCDSLSSDRGSRAAGKWLWEQCSGLIALLWVSCGLWHLLLNRGCLILTRFSGETVGRFCNATWASTVRTFSCFSFWRQC